MTLATSTLFNKCSAGYPLLDRIEVVRRGIAERPSPFLALILAILESEWQEPICILLPGKGDIARFAAIALGISRFWKAYDQRLREFAATHLTVGSRVCVQPKGDVFEYHGVWREYPGLFRLRTLPKGRQPPADLSFPLVEILRLEPTTRLSPKGNRESFDQLLPVPMDEILGLRTYGNRALFRNEVLLADAKDGFQRFATSTYLGRASTPTQLTPPSYPLCDVVPLGELKEFDNGSVALVRANEGPESGSPLVAAAHSTEILAKYCIDAPSRSKLVIVNGAARMCNLQDFDDIVQTQRIVVFADRREEAAVEILLKRSCRLWEIHGNELLDQAASVGERRKGLFSGVVERARNAVDLKIEPVECRCDALDEAARRLMCIKLSDAGDAQSPGSRAIKAAWSLVNFMAGIVEDTSGENRSALLQRIEDLTRTVKLAAQWVSVEAASLMHESVDWLRTAAELGSGLGADKKRAVLERLGNPNAADAHTLIVSRPEHVETLAGVVASSSVKPDICTSHSVPGRRFYDQVLCTSWPGSDAVHQLVSMFASADVRFLVYPFELKWLAGYRARQGRRALPNSLSASEKQRLLSAVSLSGVDWEIQSAVPHDEQATSDRLPEIHVIETWLKDIRKGQSAAASPGQELIPARYVSFCGAGYAYLTPSHRVPVATELVRAHGIAVQDLPERCVEELQIGDFIVFPESGSKELLHDLADRMLGRKAPSLRGLAGRWRRSLQESGLTHIEFQQRATQLNETRHPLTIRNWFTDERQIGPRSRDDLALIVLITNDAQLDQDSEPVWAAISELRGAHLSAGVHLRDVLMRKLPSVLNRVEEAGTKVELDDLGAAWIVQIESIAPHDEERPHTEADRLLFDGSAMLEELL